MRGSASITPALLGWSSRCSKSCAGNKVLALHSGCCAIFEQSHKSLAHSTLAALRDSPGPPCRGQTPAAPGARGWAVRWAGRGVRHAAPLACPAGSCPAAAAAAAGLAPSMSGAWRPPAAPNRPACRCTQGPGSRVRLHAASGSVPTAACLSVRACLGDTYGETLHMAPSSAHTSARGVPACCSAAMPGRKPAACAHGMRQHWQWAWAGWTAQHAPAPGCRPPVEPDGCHDQHRAAKGSHARPNDGVQPPAQVAQRTSIALRMLSPQRRAGACGREAGSMCKARLTTPCSQTQLGSKIGFKVGTTSATGQKQQRTGTGPAALPCRSGDHPCRSTELTGLGRLTHVLETALTCHPLCPLRLAHLGLRERHQVWVLPPGPGL